MKQRYQKNIEGRKCGNSLLELSYKQNMKRQKRYKNYIVLVMVLSVCIGGCSLKANKKKFDKIAEQYAQYEFSALVPQICYADTDRIIMYEDHGVLVYSIKDEGICGYAPLPDNCILQGDRAIALGASRDGKSVYAVAAGVDDSIVTKEEQVYLWNISDDSFEQVEDIQYEDLIWEPVLFEGDVDQTGSAYPISHIYTYGKQGYCYLGLESGEDVSYSDLRLVVNENDIQKEYVIFK